MDTTQGLGTPDSAAGEGLGGDLGRARLWVEGQPVSAALLVFGVLTLASAALANNFDASDFFWFIAGPAGCWALAWWYRRLRLHGQPVGPAGVRPDALWLKAGFILLAAESLIVLLAVDAPLGVALTLLFVGLRLGSRYLALAALAYGVVAGVARYAVFNRLLGQPPHHGPATPVAFGLDALLLLACGWHALRQERSPGATGSAPAGAPPGAEPAGG
jgi:hypothetical protein